MRDEKRRRLEAKGWQVGTAQEFLRLSAEEAAYVEIKVRLAMSLRKWRQRRKLTQADLAKRLQSSQSRIAKMEAGDPSVSLDLLIRSLLSLGASHRELARIMSARSSLPAAQRPGSPAPARGARATRRRRVQPDVMPPLVWARCAEPE
jgi:transcriptional regulator with XRE-family HTH domain